MMKHTRGERGMTMFYLINTFNALPFEAGYVESRHRTLSLAIKEDARYQGAIKKANGRAAYMPTIIRELNVPHKKWENVLLRDIKGE